MISFLGILLQSLPGYCILKIKERNYYSPNMKYEETIMLNNYDFSKGIKNPYANRLRKSIAITSDNSAVCRSKNPVESSDIPDQTRSDLYLAKSQK